jgi:hypothetical protein
VEKLAVHRVDPGTVVDLRLEEGLAASYVEAAQGMEVDPEVDVDRDAASCGVEVLLGASSAAQGVAVRVAADDLAAVLEMAA